MAKKKIERNDQWKINILNEREEDRNAFWKLNMWLYLVCRIEVNTCVDKEESIDEWRQRGQRDADFALCVDGYQECFHTLLLSSQQ